MTISYIIIMTAVLLSAVTFVLFGIDKHKAVKHRWRIPEATLLLASVLGGVGGLLGMLFFHHKTRKWKFRILVPLFAVFDIMVVSFFLWALDYYHAGGTALAAIENGTYDRYYLGGHSLGGAMAAVYTAGHEDEIAGEILLAAYPTKNTSVDTVLICGSEDGVLNMTRVKKAKDLVTGRYDEYCIDGGSHAQFGDYGVQTGDGEPWISSEEQQKLTLEEIGRFFGES